MTIYYRVGFKPVLDSEMIRDIKNDPEFNINLCDRFGQSFLMNAIKYERVELVEYLLSNPNININNGCRRKYTALHILCIYTNNIHILKLLLGHRNIDINKRDYLKGTALHCACYNDRVEIVRELLLDARVNPLIRDEERNTARDIAIYNENPKIANMLKRTGYTSLLRIPNALLCRDISQMIIEEYMSA